MRNVSSPATNLGNREIVRYQQWREDAEASAAAYRRWCDSSIAGAPGRFAAYLAALVQEESAARSYARAGAQLERPITTRRVTTPRGVR